MSKKSRDKIATGLREAIANIAVHESSGDVFADLGLSHAQETAHLLRSPANAARLRRSIADANAGNLIETTAKLEGWGGEIKDRPPPK